MSEESTRIRTMPGRGPARLDAGRPRRSPATGRPHAAGGKRGPTTRRRRERGSIAADEPDDGDPAIPVGGGTPGEEPDDVPPVADPGPDA